jgi:hypothetical protein
MITHDSMRRLFVALLLALALARFGQVAYSGLAYSRGDFYTTLPGAYVETFNPTLWASPDLTDTLGKQPSYRRGPTQYLTFLPFTLLDSYREIAWVLLAVFAALIVMSAIVLWRTFGDDPRDTQLLGVVLATNLVFYPTIQAYVAREFEVFILAATALLFAAATRGRQTAAGALSAYLVLYKYLPLALLPWLIARRWWRALAGLAVAAAVMLGAAHLMFGLHNFSSDGFVQTFARNVFNVGSTAEFCDSFFLMRYTPQSHDVSVRLALCGLNWHVPYPVPAVYVSIIVMTLAALGVGFFRTQRGGPLPPDRERWRTTWELSAVLIVYVTFFFAHYYYLMMLIVPLTAVLVRAWQTGRRGLWMAWAASYLLLSAFLLPLAAVTRWLQVDSFSMYLRSFAYLPGILLLVGTVLHEYIRLGTEASASRPEPPTSASSTGD